MEFQYGQLGFHFYFIYWPEFQGTEVIETNTNNKGVSEHSLGK